MMSLLSIVLTFLALILIPAALFISPRLSVPLSLTNIFGLIKLRTSKYDDDDEEKRVEKCARLLGEMAKQGRIPKHVAIILDGSSRSQRGLGASADREAEVTMLVENAKKCIDIGTNTVSLFAVSTEIWSRPEDEVNLLMALLEKFLKSEMPFLIREKIKLSVIGNRIRFPESVIGAIEEVEEATKRYKWKHIILAIDYSGRFDILQACKSLAKKARDGLIQVEEINEASMEKELMTNCSEFPYPDLLIRTNGEQSISNFFLWQSAHSEFYFPEVMWPDFGEADYVKALAWFHQRQSLFGRRV